jgi:sulfate adenylyltransferase (ADP) / adenylylsulfatase
MFAICGFCINRPISEAVQVNIISAETSSVPIEMRSKRIEGKIIYNGTQTRKTYTPPQGVSYDNNPSVFGRILDGSIPCCPIMETEDLLVFFDKYPKAKFHALVIPKTFIKTVKHLRPDRDLSIVEGMTQLALEVIHLKLPEVAITKDYILVYHVPPFNSVDHLHLHILAPSSEMSPFFRNIKYQPGTFWCIDADTVLDSLRNGITL